MRFRRYVRGQTDRHIHVHGSVYIQTFITHTLSSTRPEAKARAVARWQNDTVPVTEKNKVFPYSLPSVGPGAVPGVQAVSPQVM